jgi:hypothetical protein
MSDRSLIQHLQEPSFQQLNLGSWFAKVPNYAGSDYAYFLGNTP